MRLHARTLHMAQLTFWTSSRHTVRQMQMNTRIHTWMSHFCTRPRWRPLNESSVRIPSSVSSFLERPRYSTAVSRKYLIVTYLNRSTLLEKERNVLFVGVAKKKKRRRPTVFSVLLSASSKWSQTGSLLRIHRCTKRCEISLQSCHTFVSNSKQFGAIIYFIFDCLL